MTPKSSRNDLFLYLSEGLTSLGASWFSVGIFFVTAKLLGWGIGANLLLSAVMGVVYVVGALGAAHITKRMSRRQLLVRFYALLCLLTVCMAFTADPVIWVSLLLIWNMLIAVTWPASESLLCHGGDAEEVSRRVGRYNLVWSAASFIALAVMGMLLANPKFIFLGAAALHAVSMVLVWMTPEKPVDAEPHGHVDPPPELLAKRYLAKTLSRVALPASYTVINALTPLLASLAVVHSLEGPRQSLAVSVWLAARFMAFAVMGNTVFWHSKPGYLLIAAFVMAGAFLAAVCVPGGMPWPAQLAWVVLAQSVLGAAMGVIYFGSLYFGMVLSSGGDGDGGSTAEGGYHEALIGVGTVLGPGVGALAIATGAPAALGVGAVLAASVAACATAAWRARA